MKEKFKHTIDIRDAWKASLAKEISIAQLAKVIVDKIEVLKTNHPEFHGERNLEYIQTEMKDISEALDLDREDKTMWFDKAWDGFYNWADNNSCRLLTE